MILNVVTQKFSFLESFKKSGLLCHSTFENTNFFKEKSEFPVNSATSSCPKWMEKVMFWIFKFSASSFHHFQKGWKLSGTIPSIESPLQSRHPFSLLLCLHFIFSLKKKIKQFTHVDLKKGLKTLLRKE